MKKISIIKPHVHKGELSFQLYMYEEWKKKGVAYKEYNSIPILFLPLINRLFFPSFRINNKEARVFFVGGGSLRWGCWPDYMFCEIVPIIWDCWPIYYNSAFKFIEKYNIRTMIFTSSQTAKVMQEKYPDRNILSITEGINVSLYDEGKVLKERQIDLLEFGRSNWKVQNLDISKIGYVHVKSTPSNRAFLTEKDFVAGLANSKVTLSFPRSITHPEIAGGVETLTQRYWENMLSRVLMVGKAPKELVDLIGYNPVIDIDESDTKNQLLSIISHIENYQGLVDKNRETALRFSPWGSRIDEITRFLYNHGYTF